MKTYKLTFPCQFVDIDGNMVDGERTVMFTNKEELIEYLSGDVNGDNYGSSLLRIREHDIKLYEEVGRMCNHMVKLLKQNMVGKQK